MLTLTPPPMTSSTPHERADRRRRERTQELFLAIAETDDEREIEALRAEIVEANLSVADALARRYRSRGLATDDLVQVARLALVRVVRSFRPEFDRDFLAYAVPSITGELRKAFRDTGWVIRPPRRLQEAHGRVQAVLPELRQRLGSEPDLDQIAVETGLDHETVLEVQQLDGCFSPTSLDAPLGGQEAAGGSEEPWAAVLGTEDRAFSRAEARLLLGPLLSNLSARDRQVLELRFVHELTQREVGEHIGVTQMQVSRILARVLGQLRGQLDEDRPARRNRPVPVQAVAARSA